MKILNRWVNKVKRHVNLKEIELHLGNFTIVRRYHGLEDTYGAPFWALMHETYLYDSPTFPGMLATAIFDWENPARNVPQTVFASQFVFGDDIDGEWLDIGDEDV